MWIKSYIDSITEEGDTLVVSLRDVGVFRFNTRDKAAAACSLMSKARGKMFPRRAEDIYGPVAYLDGSDFVIGKPWRAKNNGLDNRNAD